MSNEDPLGLGNLTDAQLGEVLAFIYTEFSRRGYDVVREGESLDIVRREG